MTGCRHDRFIGDGVADSAALATAGQVYLRVGVGAAF
jgi:hypothetical protein